MTTQRWAWGAGALSALALAVVVALLFGPENVLVDSRGGELPLAVRYGLRGLAGALLLAAAACWVRSRR